MIKYVDVYLPPNREDKARLFQNRKGSGLHFKIWVLCPNCFKWMSKYHNCNNVQRSKEGIFIKRGTSMRAVQNEYMDYMASQIKNKSKLSTILGISRRTIYNFLESRNG